MTPTKKQNIIVKRKNTAFWPKTRQTRYFGKITAFDEDHGFRDFLLSLRRGLNSQEVV